MVHVHIHECTHDIHVCTHTVFRIPLFMFFLLGTSYMYLYVMYVQYLEGIYYIQPKKLQRRMQKQHHHPN